jgi:hypothetical protein
MTSALPVQWSSESAGRPGTVRYVPLRGGRRVSYGDVLRLWQDDEPFRQSFLETLAAAPFEAYRWETPAVSAATLHNDFEFVLLDAPGLQRPPEADALADQFRAAGDDQAVIAFPNLGGDAVLVVPRPSGPPSAYPHLAAFVREAPRQQVHDLWRLVGRTIWGRLNARPLWVSTAGMGVAWLHVRLDSRPKYYGFAPYREATR